MGGLRSGLFQHWQAEYAAHSVVTFPVRDDKVPALKGYLKVGPKGSEQLALNFPDALGIGLACKRNKITVLDVDTPDERVLADGLDKYGPTPFIVRSGSGNFQAWYRHNGEGRRIRPDPSVAVDILGDGYVVAPPSQANTGTYRIIQGSLDDLSKLPKMRVAQDNALSPSLREGDGRNNDLWQQCMKMARGCGRLEELMDRAMEYNRGFPEPLSADEVLKVVASAWGYEVEGKNWFGHGARVVFQTDEVDGIMDDHPDAFILLTKLRRHHWGRQFAIANGMAESMPGGGWTRKRLAAARLYLLERDIIQEVRPASRKYGPATYKFKGGRK